MHAVRLYSTPYFSWRVVQDEVGETLVTVVVVLIGSIFA